MVWSQQLHLPSAAATVIIVFALALASPVQASEPDHPAAQSSHDPLPMLTDDEGRQLHDAIEHLRDQARSLASERHSTHPLTIDEALRQVDSPRGPRQIFDWIKSNIAFEPYTGAIRGPEGTLVDGAANAADQALLAAEMISAAGYESRFVTGTLHQTDMTRIIDDALGRATLVHRDDRTPTAFTDLEAPLRTSLIRDLRQHLWLEVAAGEHFRPFDPVGAPTYGMSRGSKTQSHSSLPDEQIVHLEMNLVSHLDDGQRIQHLTVAKPLWHLAFRAISLGFERDPTRRRGHRPVMTLEGEPLLGTTIAVDALTSLQLEFSIRDTNHDHRFTQVLYQRGQGIDIFDFDHQHFAIALVPGRVTDEKVRQQAAHAAEQALQEANHWITAELDRPLDRDQQRRAINQVLDHLGPALPFALARHLDRQVDTVADVFGVTPIINRPRILTTGILRRGDRLFVDLQIGGSRLQALASTGVPPLATAAFLSFHGLLTDRLLGEMIATYADASPPTVDAIFSEARRQSIPFITIDPQRMDRLDLIEVQESTRTTIEDQVRRRHMVVLAPLRPVDDDGLERFGWWAVNPFDGNLEGHTSDAVVAVARDDGQASTSRLSLLATHLRLVNRHFQAASQAIGNSDRFDEAICATALDLDRYSRGFCAIDQAMPRAHLTTCLTQPPAPGGDLLRMTPIDCGEQLAELRCASAYAVALLVGRLVVADDGDDDLNHRSLPAPLCD